MAQLVEQLLLIPEVRGSNQVISKNLFKFNVCLLSIVNWKDENKDKEAGNGPFFLKKILFTHLSAAPACVKRTSCEWAVRFISTDVEGRAFNVKGN